MSKRFSPSFTYLYRNKLKISHLSKQVGKIFKNLPKSLKWKSFYDHDLPILMDIGQKVIEAPTFHPLLI
jgi:hypothetical protein